MKCCLDREEGMLPGMLPSPSFPLLPRKSQEALVAMSEAAGMVFGRTFHRIQLPALQFQGQSPVLLVGEPW